MYCLQYTKSDELLTPPVIKLAAEDVKKFLPDGVKNFLPTHVKNSLPRHVKNSLPCGCKITLPRTYCSARYKAGDFHNPVKRPNPCKLKGFGGSRNDQFKAWIQAILSIPLQYTCYYKERSDNNTAYQAYKINIGIDMKVG